MRMRGVRDGGERRKFDGAAHGSTGARRRPRAHALDAALGCRTPATAAGIAPGVTPRARADARRGGRAVVLLLAVGWAWSIAMRRPRHAPRNAARASTAGDDGRGAHRAPTRRTAAYLTDATLNALVEATRAARAESCARDPAGAGTPLVADSLPAGATLRVAAAATAAGRRRRRRRASGTLAVAIGNAHQADRRLQRHQHAAVQREAERARRPLLHRQLAGRERGRSARRARRRPTAINPGRLHRGHAGRTRTPASPSTSSFATSSRTTSRTSGRSTSCCRCGTSTSSSSC